MAKIYSAPSSITVPVLDFKNLSNYDKDCEKFKAELSAFCLARKKDKNVGEVIRFQVADGYAEYMVASTKPVELIHLPFWDCYQFEYAHLLTAKEIQGKIDQEAALAKLFKK